MSFVRTVALLVSGVFAAWPAIGAASAAAPSPVVVELFTSQGCSSCPPANATLAALADRPDVIALSFGVTYWDQLGWKDTFASQVYTGRQWDYARGLHHAHVFTPQIVVQGRADTVGQTLRQVEPLIRAAKTSDGSLLSVAISGNNVTLSASRGALDLRNGADVWLVRYDPRTLPVPIQAGENEGRTLPHRNVVRELRRLGAWSGQLEAFVVEPSRDLHLRTAILVQAGRGGPIVAAAKD